MCVERYVEVNLFWLWLQIFEVWAAVVSQNIFILRVHSAEHSSGIMYVLCIGSPGMYMAMTRDVHSFSDALNMRIRRSLILVRFVSFESFLRRLLAVKSSPAAFLGSNYRPDVTLVCVYMFFFFFSCCELFAGVRVIC